MSSKGFFRLSLLAACLTLMVVMLGAWVRLGDAGLGCPDWPGCYGMLLGVPQTEEAISAANQAYPERLVEVGKAWKEMIHRYAAGTLGLLVLGLAVLAIRNRRDPAQPLALPMLLVGLIVAQSVLGMWTVTWQLKPLVVTLHLLGGMTTAALLWWLTLRQGRFLVPDLRSPPETLRKWSMLVLVLVIGQIALGGWVSTNYAALACTDFPTCHGEWIPDADYAQGFTLWHGLGVDYEFGVLDHPARVAIQFVHRLGAIVVALAVLALAIAIWRQIAGSLASRVAVALVLIVTLQWGLGIANVLMSLPLPIAVAHNGGAALLLLSMVTLCHSLRPLSPAREPSIEVGSLYWEERHG